MKSKVTLLSLFLLGCGAFPRPIKDAYNRVIPPRIVLPSIEIDPVLQPYISDYLSIASSYNIDTRLSDKLRIVEFGKVDENIEVVGGCFLYQREDTNELTYTKIVISDQFTDQSARDEQPYLFKALVMHELTHCILLRGHEPQDPEVIMSPVMSSESFYESNWDQLVSELFTGTPIQYTLPSHYP